jgi:hypothetical protein
MTEDGFPAKILMTQVIYERGVACRTVAVATETVVCVLVPVGIDAALYAESACQAIKVVAMRQSVVCIVRVSTVR